MLLRHQVTLYAVVGRSRRAGRGWCEIRLPLLNGARHYVQVDLSPPPCAYIDHQTGVPFPQFIKQRVQTSSMPNFGHAGTGYTLPVQLCLQRGVVVLEVTKAIMPAVAAGFDSERVDAPRIDCIAHVRNHPFPGGVHALAKYLYGGVFVRLYVLG